jgi:hypothetical protein
MSVPGISSHGYKLIKWTWEAAPEWFIILFNSCLYAGYHPRDWRKAVIGVVPKLGKLDYSLPKSYRLVALLECLSKLLEKVMAKQILHDIGKFGLSQQTNLGPDLTPPLYTQDLPLYMILLSLTAKVDAVLPCSLTSKTFLTTSTMTASSKLSTFSALPKIPTSGSPPFSKEGWLPSDLTTSPLTLLTVELGRSIWRQGLALGAEHKSEEGSTDIQRKN